MRELTSLDHLAIAQEVQSLIGKRFQKLSRITGGYKLKLRGQDILILLPDKVYPTSYSVPSLRPDNLSMRARKLLYGKRLTGVATLNLDRVLRLDFEELSIILELFRGGNVVLLEGNVVVDVLRPGVWRHRRLEPGVEYLPPPPPPVSKGELSPSSDAIRTLVRSGIPEPYALEVLHTLGLRPEDPPPAVDVVLDALGSLLERLKKPGGYLCDGEPFPIPLSYKNCILSVPSFSSILDSFTPSLLSSERKDRPSKLHYMLRSLEELESEISQLEALINYIYEHWSDVEKATKTGDFSSLPFRVKGREGRKIRLEFTP